MDIEHVARIACFEIGDRRYPAVRHQRHEEAVGVDHPRRSRQGLRLAAGIGCLAPACAAARPAAGNASRENRRAKRIRAGCGGVQQALRRVAVQRPGGKVRRSPAGAIGEGDMVNRGGRGGGLPQNGDAVVASGQAEDQVIARTHHDDVGSFYACAKLQGVTGLPPVGTFADRVAAIALVEDIGGVAGAPGQNVIAGAAGDGAGQVRCAKIDQVIAARALPEPGEQVGEGPGGAIGKFKPLDNVAAGRAGIPQHVLDRDAVIARTDFDDQIAAMAGQNTEIPGGDAGTENDPVDDAGIAVAIVGNNILAIAKAEIISVGTRPAAETIVAGATTKNVIAATTLDIVIASAALDSGTGDTGAGARRHQDALAGVGDRNALGDIGVGPSRAIGENDAVDDCIRPAAGRDQDDAVAGAIQFQNNIVGRIARCGDIGPGDTRTKLDIALAIGRAIALDDILAIAAVEHVDVIAAAAKNRIIAGAAAERFIGGSSPEQVFLAGTLAVDTVEQLRLADGGAISEGNLRHAVLTGVIDKIDLVGRSGKAQDKIILVGRDPPDTQVSCPIARQFEDVVAMAGIGNRLRAIALVEQERIAAPVALDLMRASPGGNGIIAAGSDDQGGIGRDFRSCQRSANIGVGPGYAVRKLHGHRRRTTGNARQVNLVA